MINISNKIVFHPECDRALSTIARMHESANAGGVPETLRLLGASGVGKSSLLRLYRDRHPRRVDEQGTVLPVVYVSVSSQPTPKQFATQFLAALDMPGIHYVGLAPYTDQIRTLVREMKSELALIDESQHFVDRGREKTRTAMADFLKEVTEAIEIPVVMAGAPRMELLFSENSQLRRRFYATERLRPFSLHRPEVLRGFVYELAADFDGRDRNWFVDEAVTRRMFFASDGIPANIVALLRTAYRLRQASGAPLNLATMSDAFRLAVWATPGRRKDPFGEKFIFERLRRPNEPFAPNRLDGDNHDEGDLEEERFELEGAET